MKEVFFTPDEMQMIRVCLYNAPIPYDQGEGAKKIKVLQEKVGKPKTRKGEPLPLIECDLTKYEHNYMDSTSKQNFVK